MPAATDCNSGGPGAGTWTGVTGDQQRFACWAQSDGISRLEWASSTGPFAVQVWRHDADIAALAGWYQQVGYRVTAAAAPCQHRAERLTTGRTRWSRTCRAT